MPEDDAESGDSNGDSSNGTNRLETNLPGIEVKTQLADGDVEEIERVHRQQLEWALEHAKEAKESTRI